MMKRFWAIVLCLAMLMSYAVPSVYATEDTTVGTDDIYVGDGATVNHLTTDTKEEGSSSVVENTSNEKKLPTCDCGVDADMIDHADTCTLKRYYVGVSGLNAAEIYTDWELFPEDAQSFILQYLSWNDQNKLAYLQSMLNTDLSGSASTKIEGAVISVSGIPAGGSVTVTQVMQTRSSGTSATEAAIEELLADRESDAGTNRLFMWDISVQDDNGSDWQPFATPVAVEVTIPGVKLHPYTQVLVIHVGDDGKANYVNATVTEDGGISFTTTGFSTFAGFTVDFDYEGVQFSIPGKTGILLSELFDKLKMPLSVSDVADVTFTNYDLVTVAEQTDGDWLLTSLVAFDTEEKLTITMDDGTVYNIKVTDAVVKVKHGEDGSWSETDGQLIWYADGDGDLNADSKTDYWTRDKGIYFKGAGTLEIVIRPNSNADSYKVNLKQIEISGGAQVTIKLGAGFDNISGECIIRAVSTSTMFDVQNGTLTLQGRAGNGAKLALDGSSKGTSIDVNNEVYATENPIIYMAEDATSLSVNHAIFRDAQDGGIRCRSNTATLLEVKNTTFENTVNRTGYTETQSTAKTSDDKEIAGDRGGAICVTEATNKNNYVVDIDKIWIENCTFTGNDATGRGGAVSIYGRVRYIGFRKCTFSSCDSDKGGGAICIASTTDEAVIAGCTFKNCTTKTYVNEEGKTVNTDGGAVEFFSRQHTSVNTEKYSRINSIAIRNASDGAVTSFTSCSATSQGGAVALKSQTYSVLIQNVEFSQCSTGLNGGAVSVGYVKLLQGATQNWVTTPTGSTHTVQDFVYDWDDTSGYLVHSTFNKVEIDNCDFKGCYAKGSLGTNGNPSGAGGGICFEGQTYVADVDITNTTFDACWAQWSGSAVLLNSGIFVNFTITGNDDEITFQNCDFQKNTDKVTYPTSTESGQGGGTVRTYGNTTANLELINCYFKNNHSRIQGGGLYWNALRSRAGVTCKATVRNCDFEGNTAAGDGGGIFCEAYLVTDNCRIYNNTAVKGGGIAQQVYNNDDALMMQGYEKTDLTLDAKTVVRNNTATNGGGISVMANSSDSIDGYVKDSSGNNTTTLVASTYTVRFQLNGASIYSNTANALGGGIYFTATGAKDQTEVDEYIKKIQIDNGKIYSNTATTHGGGIYMASSNNTELSIEGGEIYSNKATNKNGGGVFMTGKNAECKISGGTIGGSTAKANTAGNNGGGIHITGGAKITVTGTCEISYNEATNHGGGISVGATTPADINNKKLPNNSIDITGGTITQNKAGTYGGGVYVGRLGDFDITSGNITYNSAKNGGGIALYYKDENDPDAGETDGEYVCSADAMIKGGKISNNSATEDGGGIYAYNTSTVTMQKSTDGTVSTIENNTAGEHGGGIYVDTNSTITLSDGNVLNNTATKGNGGGLHVAFSSIVTITNGNVKYNVASAGYGGGVHAWDNSTINITGGTLQENTAKDGGGIAAEESSVINVSDTGTRTDDTGTIYKNTATEYGGGIFAQSGSEVKVTGGSIKDNSAASGGGIAAQGGADVTMEGGSITLNVATADGAGVWGRGTGSIIKVLGGSIVQNTATGSGGGVYLDDNAQAEISTSTDGSTHGTISNNIAARGGGVCVADGADLTVKNGYVINNKAVGTPTSLKTAWKQNANLLGVGGGIYIADGKSDADPATFTLTGSDIAIYGNLAEFGADDVFANGNYTKLTVPLVSQMNLAGYKSKADGWFEDYPTGDNSYVEGLNGLKLATGAATTDVLRYRNTTENVQARVEVVPYTDATTGNSVLLANVANEYVCMTLGLTGAVDDTIVIDFGLPVDIDTLNNDEAITHLNSIVGGLRVEAPTSTEMPGTNTSALLTNFAGTISTDYFTATVVDNGTRIQIQLASMNVTEPLTFWYAVNYNNGYRFYYAKVTVIPATSIYYEDNAGMIEYYGHVLTKNESGTTVRGEGQEDLGWSTVGSTITGTQGSDLPGADVDNALDNLDMDYIYGYDAAYKDQYTYSMGSAHMVTVNANQSASVTFSFTGTGFDIVSLTDSAASLIVVKVTGTNYNKSFIVDNYYTQGTLYQVPVIKVNGLTHGQYSVEIYVAYGAAFDHDKDEKCTFYLDAIRIYDPAQGNATVEDIHKEDGELYPTYRELRNMVISADTFNELGDNTVSGIVFIDKTGTSVGITDYQNYGPNNELYLASGQAIAFNLVTQGTDVNKVHLGIRAIGGAGSVKIYNGTSSTAAATTAMDITSGTDMYYALADGLNGQTVVILNSGSNMISLTNIKTTHNSAQAAPTGEEEIMVVNEDTGSNAIASIIAEPVVPTIVPAGASLAFDDEIRYNIYFTALNLGNVTVDNMGLAVFAGNETDGTVDTAVELIPGAVADGEEYMVHTNGIPAKNLGDTVYFKIYVKLADGTYVYSDLHGYNAVAYAQEILANSSNDKMKALVVSMLNYGTAAQQYFGYKTDELMNASLTEAQKAYGVSYSEDMITQLSAADTNKIGAFAANGGFTDGYPAVSFEGVFAINYYFTPAYSVDGDMTFYYWTQDDYESADVLTAENASGSMVMNAVDGVYQATVGDIAAKQIDETVYVVGVYESEGTVYTTGVLVYSLSAYCADRIANGTGMMPALAKATVAYGYSAKAYFGM